MGKKKTPWQSLNWEVIIIPFWGWFCWNRLILCITLFDQLFSLDDKNYIFIGKFVSVESVADIIDNNWKLKVLMKTLNHMTDRGNPHHVEIIIYSYLLLKSIKLGRVILVLSRTANLIFCQLIDLNQADLDLNQADLDLDQVGLTTFK